MRLKESINQNQINLLKATYGDIKKINPNSAAVKKLMMVLKKLSKDDLETISKAKINFVSTMAQSILRDSNVSESAEMDNLQKRKNDLLKQVDPLIAKKKKLYSDVDITTPKSSDEKKLDKEIADLFSEINDLVHKIVKLKKSQNEGRGIMKEANINWKEFYTMAKDTSGHNPNFEKKYGNLMDRPHIADALKKARDFNSFLRAVKQFESVTEEIAVGKMVKVVNNPHWEAALGKKGPFKRKVKMIDGDNVFFTDGSNSSMKYVKEDIQPTNEADVNWNAVQNAIINFLKMNTKILDKKVQAKDTEGVKGGLKSIISGLTNAQRSLKLESVNEVTLTERKYYVSYNKGRGQGKGLSMEFDNKTFRTLDKPKVFNSYEDAKKYADTMEKTFRNSIGGGTAYWVSDEKMNPIKESVNEAASRTAMEIGGLTGLNKDAVQKFVDTHNMDIEAVYQYIKKSKITDRLNFVTAVVGNPGNPFQKTMIKMFGESINEAVSKTFKIPTQRGILHLEVEEDPAGIFVDVIFNKVDIATTDIQFPTGEVKITQKQKRVKLTESIKESAKKSTFTKVARISNNGKLYIY